MHTKLSISEMVVKRIFCNLAVELKFNYLEIYEQI